MAIEIISSGLATTLQDGGRFGYQDQGIPVSGFMDGDAAHIANLLLNNPPNAVMIEMTMVGIKFKAIQELVIAITGADMQPKLNGEALTMYKALTIPKDAVVSFSGAKNGVYSYIAVLGGFDIQDEFGSKSTYTPAKLGGFYGRKLEKGDVLPVPNKKITQKLARVKAIDYKQNAQLYCLKGPEWDWFSEESKTAFLETTFKIHQHSNRIGIRLEGTLLKMPKRDEIISSGIVKGTVQITKGGQPIVMMADAPTTGGYLRIVNLTQHACHILAQIPPGGTVQFVLK
ncbi:biotin-dependent carboxyltransferase family protein [Wenyingzhuangia sp. 1_MG-2023]|nr:biotin-dependent carboxyltransferase family protein [Wenyingzhuangia sp. 1_MG-2023]